MKWLKLVRNQHQTGLDEKDLTRKPPTGRHSDDFIPPANKLVDTLYKKLNIWTVTAAL